MQQLENRVIAWAESQPDIRAILVVGSRAQRDFPADERAAFLKALILYYSGRGNIKAVFDGVEPGPIDRYYRRKKAFPGEVTDIDREARAEALQVRSAEGLAFQAEHERESRKLQATAAAYFVDVVPELVRIASGEPCVYFDRVTQTEKELKVYPRDQVAASRMLLDAAKSGLLPTNWRSSVVSAVETDRDEDKGGLMPMFGVNTAFKKLTGIRPDGMDQCAASCRGQQAIRLRPDTSLN